VIYKHLSILQATWVLSHIPANTALVAGSITVRDVFACDHSFNAKHGAGQAAGTVSQAFPKTDQDSNRVYQLQCREQLPGWLWLWTSGS